jgi:hypothetical protein
MATLWSPTLIAAIVALLAYSLSRIALVVYRTFKARKWIAKQRAAGFVCVPILIPQFNAPNHNAADAQA